jgi:hypothetical protein
MSPHIITLAEAWYLLKCEPLLYYRGGVVFFLAEGGSGYQLLEQLHRAAKAFFRRHCTSATD